MKKIDRVLFLLSLAVIATLMFACGVILQSYGVDPSIGVFLGLGLATLLIEYMPTLGLK